MADLKISQLPVFTSAVPATDAFAVVSGGTTKQITTNQILGAGGTATLASATITGDLTVRTNKLFVNATGVGIGNAGPLSVLTVSSQTDARLSVRTTEAVFGSIVGGTALDSLNDAATVLVPFGCRGSTISFAASGQNVGLQLDASSNVNVPLGNVVMGTSGKGIDFSATASGSGTMTSELLNDYEEGTFTPTISSGATAVTFSTQDGKYTKIGRLVTVFIRLVTTAATRNGSQFIISGLPFSAVTDGSGVIAYNSSGFISTAGGNKPNLLIGGADINFFTSSGGNFVGTAIAADVFEVRLTATYYV